jgi:hypothetical protein
MCELCNPPSAGFFMPYFERAGHLDPKVRAKLEQELMELVLKNQALAAADNWEKLPQRIKDIISELKYPKDAVLVIARAKVVYIHPRGGFYIVG